eukprot:8949286-Ditylum_brightwellii.AAC.1
METRRARRKKRKDEPYKQVLTNLQADYTADQVCSAKRAGKSMKHWINAVPLTDNNSVIGQDEFCDIVLLSLQHALQHKKEGSLEAAMTINEMIWGLLPP